MRVYRRFDGGPWWVDFWHAGRRVRKSAGTTDRQAAQEFGDRLKADLWRESRLGDRPAVSWDNAVLDWLAASGELRSIEDRRDQLRWLSKHLAGKPLAAIDRRELERLATLKAAEGAAPATVNRHLAALSAVLRRAHAQGYLDSLPAIPRRREAAKRVAWATQEQAAKLVDALPAHWAAMVEFSLATGLRRHNVTHLRWSEVDLRRRLATVHADEAKGQRTLSVPLAPAALDVLRRQKGAHRTYVFTGERKTPVERIEAKVWRAAVKAAGLPAGFRWHDLRHTWATWHVQNGTPLAVLQQLGGWRTYGMVLRYAHFAPDHVAGFAANAGLKRVRNRAQSRAGLQSRKAA